MTCSTWWMSSARALSGEASDRTARLLRRPGMGQPRRACSQYDQEHTAPHRCGPACAADYPVPLPIRLDRLAVTAQMLADRRHAPGPGTERMCFHVFPLCEHRVIPPSARGSLPRAASGRARSGHENPGGASRPSRNFSEQVCGDSASVINFTGPGPQAAAAFQGIAPSSAPGSYPRSSRSSALSSEEHDFITCSIKGCATRMLCAIARRSSRPLDRKGPRPRPGKSPSTSAGSAKPGIHGRRRSSLGRWRGSSPTPMTTTVSSEVV
jgi:hypothetical protein